MKIKSIFIMIFSLLLLSCNGDENKNILEESGTAEAVSVIVSAERAGKIEKIILEEGDLVSVNDTLLILDSELLQIKLSQVLAMEKIAFADLQLAKKGARSEDVKTASEKLKQAELNFELAEKDYKRFSNLIKEDVITKNKFDQIKTKYELSIAALSSAKAQFKKVKNITRAEELLKAEANYERAKANSAEIKKLINDSFIVSPIKGTIVKQFAELGENINPMSSLFKVADLENIEVTIYIAETDLGKIKIGQKAEIISDTYEDRNYSGSVIFISPEAEFTPKNVQTKDERVKLVYAVKIKVKNVNQELKSGMPVDVKINLN